MTLRIRRVDVSDPLVREAIHLMHAELYTRDDWTGGAVPRFSTGDWWVAFDEEQPVAFAGMRPSSRWEKTGYLCSSGVLPSARGRGLQKVLIRKRVARAKEYGWHTVITDTMSDNAASMRSLISCGFRPYIPAVRWGTEYSVYWKRGVENRPI